MKKSLLLASACLTLGVAALTSCSSTKENYDVIATSFAGYDFARAVCGDKMSCGMLLNPGEELHDYSPSISDIESIINSKVFIYIGGESDEEWVEHQILPEIDATKTTVINMMEVIEHEGGNTYEEEEPASAETETTTSTLINSFMSLSHEHEEGEEEYDEHIWNSLTNAKILVNEINEAVSAIDGDNKDTYAENTNKYVAKLNEVDNNIKDVVSSASKNLLIFADRFPLLYFVKEYGLEYDAAFKGCETAKEASHSTIESLTNKVIENNITTIFEIELSESNIAETIQTNCSNQGVDVSIRTFYTMHNVSKDEYQKGTTYVDFMNLNIESLRIALN